MTALIVEPGVNTGMPILYENPAEVGADRIVNAIAAYEQFGRGAGAAADRRRLRHRDDARRGHARRASTSAARSVPGVQISADALFQRAARLPRIDVRKPAAVVGRTTVGAMESGLFYGYVGMVEGLVRRMSDELGGNALCVATGGLADVIAPETTLIEHVDPDLTLHGLRIVWERNQKSADRDRDRRYCREIETYLCRKNDGHLIRVVGPSFDLVVRLGGAGRAAQGRVQRHRSVLRALLPQGAAPAAGEDRLLRGRRARRVRRMAPGGRAVDAVVSRRVGSRRVGSHAAAESAARQSLPAHLERVVLRLTSRARQRRARRRRSTR